MVITNEGKLERSCKCLTSLLLSSPTRAVDRSWYSEFSYKVLGKVIDEAFGAKAPNYATILRLDRLVRDDVAPSHVRVVNVGREEPGTPEWHIIQKNMMFILVQRGMHPLRPLVRVAETRVSVIVLLHRAFFAQAICDHPEDPLKSKYAQSVLAAFRSAFYITTAVRAVFAQSQLAKRFWVFSSQGFSASVSHHTKIMSHVRLSDLNRSSWALLSFVVRRAGLPQRHGSNWIGCAKCTKSARIRNGLRRCWYVLTVTNQRLFGDLCFSRNCARCVLELTRHTLNSGRLNSR